MVLPTIPPMGRLRQRGAVGWSMSGAMPPIMLATTATMAVARVTFSRGCAKTTSPSAVKAARS